MRQEDFWFWLLAAWIVLWFWIRYKSNSLKLKYLKFWGDVPEEQRRGNLVELGMTVLLVAVNLLIRVFGTGGA